MPPKKIPGWDLLHPKQQQLYELLLQRKADDGLTLADMRTELGVESLNTIVHHIKQLERKGYVRRNSANKRIEVLNAPVRDIVYLNLYGTAGCSPEGFFNDDNICDRIPFPARQLRVNPDSFLIEARGDSMEPMIHDHDLVLIDRKPLIDGSIGLIVDDSGAKIKQVYRIKGNVVLYSLNTRYKPVIKDPAEIREVGVVRGVVRSFVENNLRVKKSRS